MIAQAQTTAGIDRTVADQHSRQHKNYINSLADRVDRETEKLLKRIGIMRIRIAQELEDERLQRVVRAQVTLEAEHKGWSGDEVEKQVLAANQFLLDVLQSEIMLHLGTLATAKTIHHRDKSAVTYMAAFIRAIDDPEIRKMAMQESKKALEKAGIHVDGLDAILGSMPRLRAVIKRDSRGMVEGIGLRLKGVYADTWRLAKASHRERVAEICTGITESCPLDRQLMAKMMGVAAREVEGMVPGAVGSHFTHELSRLGEQVSAVWGLDLDPKNETPSEPEPPASNLSQGP